MSSSNFPYHIQFCISNDTESLNAHYFSSQSPPATPSYTYKNSSSISPPAASSLRRLRIRQKICYAGGLPVWPLSLFLSHRLCLLSDRSVFPLYALSRFPPVFSDVNLPLPFLPVRTSPVPRFTQVDRYSE